MEHRSGQGQARAGDRWGPRRGFAVAGGVAAVLLALMLALLGGAPRQLLRVLAAEKGGIAEGSRPDDP